GRDAGRPREAAALHPGLVLLLPLGFAHHRWLLSQCSFGSTSSQRQRPAAASPAMKSLLDLLRRIGTSAPRPLQICARCRIALRNARRLGYVHHCAARTLCSISAQVLPWVMLPSARSGGA